MFFTYREKAALIILLAAFFVALDRLLKIISISVNPKINIFYDIFTFNYTKNVFISFSIPLTGPWLAFLILIIIIFLCGFVVSLIFQKKLLALPLIFTIAGAASNLYDRFVYGFVIDYFDLEYFTVFNLADTLISGSLAIFLFMLIKEKNWQ